MNSLLNGQQLHASNINCLVVNEIPNEVSLHIVLCAVRCIVGLAFVS